MGTGDPKHRHRWCSLWLCLLLLCVAGSNLQASVVVQALPGHAEAAEVLSGALDTRLDEPQSPVIRLPGGTQGWFRITTRELLVPDSAPKLVLRSPFISRVEAWVPGRESSTRHGLYGELADFRYSHRALVIDLPQGLGEGEAVWLRVEAQSSMPMLVSIEAMEDVQRDDLAYVAWRTFILSVLMVLALLAFAFGIGTGEASYGWFGAMLCCAVLYLVSISGDFRMLPGAEAVFGGTPQSNRIVGGLGVLCSNLFQRAYLDLPRKLPRLNRLLWIGTALAIASAMGSLFINAGWLASLGNVGLLLSAALLLVGSTLLALRGDRPGRVVMASWLPLMAFTTLVATEMMGLWTGPSWLSQGLAGSFALASLLLTIGLADKLLELRRDRDHASAQARADDLTGLYNRAGIEEEFRRVMAASRARNLPMCIAFVDLDHFKQINDAHGHSIGDQCLRIVSQRIRNQLRGRDIVGRYGGDEFLVVLPGTRLHEALRVAERMRLSVNCRPLTMDDVQIDGTLSIGVAELQPDESAEQLFERADAALYGSKQSGRDNVTGARVQAGELAAT